VTNLHHGDTETRRKKPLKHGGKEGAERKIAVIARNRQTNFHRGGTHPTKPTAGLLGAEARRHGENKSRQLP
jgi:hypothetical protein